ncbi:hypothetical protein BCR32DRAFT_243969 [Anaeromyces robustus]|uniref:Uncharacterized protein n=1 Tax=Anaeromyces robustus TaxID=1754192 RepID=A0A1Y1XB75_9FUNG|nr:hypothetical protein BCR32DRAFT_243969 [Anaeromyces robustus]|eukprot:ORX82696.1 hypothetical protein BCR32DRAFT_243969 [Anaeromyces robustus]
MAPASKRPLTPKKRVLPIKCTCEGLYNMIFYNYKKEQTNTHLIHVIMREGKTYKSLRDIVDILNETLEMNLTVRTLTQGTGHYVLQKDRVTANLPCQNTASGYKGTVFVNDIGVHDTLVKYLNASNSTIQNRNNATMDNIRKVRINANTLVQMLVKQDTLFQMREGVDPKSIPTEHDIKIGRRSRSTTNSKNANKNGDSDLSPLSCLAMLASQANQLPTEDGTIRRKIMSLQNHPDQDNRNSEYNTPVSAKSNNGADERKRQRADSENDAFRKTVKTEVDEYVANPRINDNMETIRHPDDNPVNVTTYMDLEPRPMSAPANLERSSINDSDSETNELDEKFKESLVKSLNLEKSHSQNNSPVLKKSKNTSKSNKKKGKSKGFDNKKKNSISKRKDMEKGDNINENVKNVIIIDNNNNNNNNNYNNYNSNLYREL